MLKASNIYKSYGKAEILKDLTLDINKGDCVGIIGGNGCGKTTLLKIICGIISADNGIVTLQGNKLSPKDYRQKIGYLPQTDPLIGELSVKDNISLWQYAMGISGKGTDNNRLELGIDSFLHKSVNTLSGGMKRRVSLCIALLNNASILVMDEPTTALDLSAKADLWGFLNDVYIKQGGTVLITTHDYAEMQMCNRLMVMENGRLNEVSIDEVNNSLGGLK